MLQFLIFSGQNLDDEIQKMFQKSLEPPVLHYLRYCKQVSEMVSWLDPPCQLRLVSSVD